MTWDWATFISGMAGAVITILSAAGAFIYIVGRWKGGWESFMTDLQRWRSYVDERLRNGEVQFRTTSRFQAEVEGIKTGLQRVESQLTDGFRDVREQFSTLDATYVRRGVYEAHLAVHPANPGDSPGEEGDVS